MNRKFWSGRRVFVTGHTGFKGSWLSLWLADMGAEVHGYALAPATTPSFFELAHLQTRLVSSTLADVRDANALSNALATANPEVVLHLAAQPLVRRSYVAPIETYAVNVMGTANLLEAARRVQGIRAIVNVTTDKCYENREWLWPYREDEAMGGFDPYSSSKACSELVTAAYRRSFLEAARVGLASARAGNVIGGGDWAEDRLVPDLLRSLDQGETVAIRSPNALRPWQHVLEPLSGYLTLAERLFSEHDVYSGAWNFGPAESDCVPVRWIVERICNDYPSASWSQTTSPQPHEANALKLDSSKARAKLQWRPVWGLDTALSKTLEWHKHWRQGRDIMTTSLEQIHRYESDAKTP